MRRSIASELTEWADGDDEEGGGRTAPCPGWMAGRELSEFAPSASLDNCGEHITRYV